MKHASWDRGVMKDALGSMYIEPKTITTLCHKRVKPLDIDNENTTCNECNATILKERQLALDLLFNDRI